MCKLHGLIVEFKLIKDQDTKLSQSNIWSIARGLHCVCVLNLLLVHLLLSGLYWTGFVFLFISEIISTESAYIVGQQIFSFQVVLIIPVYLQTNFVADALFCCNDVFLCRSWRLGGSMKQLSANILRQSFLYWYSTNYD
jgi:hypothetical protein